MRGEANGLQSKERIVIKWEKVCTFLFGFADKQILSKILILDIAGDWRKRIICENCERSAKPNKIPLWRTPPPPPHVEALTSFEQ